jgi:hypothetical protein
MMGASSLDINLVANEKPGLITKHVFHILMDFPYSDAVVGQRLSRLSARAIDTQNRIGIIHPDRRGGAESESQLFVESAFEIGDDLHPSVVTALRGCELASGSEAAGVGCLHLSARGRAILNGDWAGPRGDPRDNPDYLGRRGLAINLGPDGRRRIEEASGTPSAEALVITIADVTLLTFGSTLGLAIVQCELQGDIVLLAALQETVHIIAHSGRHGSLAWACQTKPVAQFTLSEVVGCLLESAGCAPQLWNRLYTYTFALLAPFTNDPRVIETAAWRLSRHYTDAYNFGPDAKRGGVIFRPFDDVVHAASIEGAATLGAANSTFLAEDLRKIHCAL